MAARGSVPGVHPTAPASLRLWASARAGRVPSTPRQEWASATSDHTAQHTCVPQPVKADGSTGVRADGMEFAEPSGFLTCLCSGWGGLHMPTRRMSLHGKSRLPYVTNAREAVRLPNITRQSGILRERPQLKAV